MHNIPLYRRLSLEVKRLHADAETGVRIRASTGAVRAPVGMSKGGHPSVRVLEDAFFPKRHWYEPEAPLERLGQRLDENDAARGARGLLAHASRPL